MHHRSKDAASTDWAGGTLTRTVSNYRGKIDILLPSRELDTRSAMLFARRHSLDSHTRFVGWLLVFVLSWHSALFPALAASRCGDSLTTRDAKGQVTRMGYDIRGRMNRRALPDGKSESMVYDALGQLRQKTDFLGDTTTFDYDERGRMTLKRPAQRLLDAGDVAVTMSYTGENFKVVKRGALTTTYTSDANRGWLSSVSSPTGTIDYDYDVSGNRTSVSAAGGITAYSYDELGRMKTVSDKPTGALAFKLLATYSYDEVGNLQSTV